jgi:hypothetical protein
MQPRRWYTLLLLLVPVLAFSQIGGKIRGKVVDQKTLEGLVGANVLVVGTSMGAATDVNGEFIVLNVPSGSYDITARYVGYETVTLKGIRVIGGLTAEANFQLPAAGVELPTVQIVAERPLVNKSATSTIRVVEQEFFTTLPSRGINAVISLQPGIVDIGGVFYARGSRAEDMKFTLDGAPINNPIAGGRGISIIQEAVEEMQVLMGGYSAEYGGTNGALVKTQYRTAGEKWNGSFTAETDKYASVGQNFLGAYPDNIANFVVTAGGGITSNLRLFVSGAYYYNGPGYNTWSGPFDFGKFTTLKQVTPAHPTAALTDTIELSGWGGGSRGEWAKNYLSAATLTWDLHPTQIRFSGTYNYNPYKNGLSWTQREINPHLTTEGHSTDALGTVKLTQFFGEKTFLELSGNYYFTNYEAKDPDFGNNYILYGDSAANAARGVAMRGTNYFFGASTIVLGGETNTASGFPTYSPAGTGYSSGYNKGKTQGYGGRLDISSQISKAVELKGGAEFQSYTYRRWAPADIMSWAGWNKTYKPDFSNYNAASTQLFRALARKNSNSIGYDLFGNEISDNIIVNDPNGAYMDSQGPLQPLTIGAYAQAKVELRDLTMTVGLRYDYFNTDTQDLLNRNSLTFNDSLRIVNQSNFVKSRPLDYLQPRIGFSFPVTDRTVFRANFGRFVQLLRLQEMVNAPTALSGILFGGYFYLNTYAFGIAPQATTNYEVGFQQQLGEVASLDVTGFYKDITGQLQYTMYYPAIGAENGSYPLYINNDFTTTKGLEIRINLRRTQRLSGVLTYTWSDAKTTGSSTTQTNGIWGTAGLTGPYLPRYIQPASFNQGHRGNLIMDYRFGKNDGGPILEQLGLNLQLIFHSGQNWTRVYSPVGDLSDPRDRYPLEEVGGSTTPWGFRLDGRLDKTIDIGPISLNLFVRATNILNAFIPTGVKATSGDVFNTGYLNSLDGKAQAATYGQYAKTWAHIYDYFNNSTRAGYIEAPRTVIVGVKVDI